MSQTLLTGASGLLAHQRKLDIVANNLANINTTAYKSQRVLFSDLLYNTLQPASGPAAEANIGGTNPQQIGFGVEVSNISNNFSQGVLTATGESFDFAIQGDGFFVVQGAEQQFTRDGSFTLDQNGQLVNPSTGGLVQRFGTIGDENGFQSVGETSIFVPLGASVPGRQTTESGFVGNLPATASPPLAEVLVTASPLTAGGAPATAATLINDLDINSVDYIGGDILEVVATNSDGSSFSINFPLGPTATLGDLTAAIDAEITGASIAIDALGNLVVTADEAGESFLSVNLDDADTNTGSSDYNASSFLEEIEGNDGGTFESTIQVFDLRGSPSTLQVSFEKQDHNRWNARFSSGSEDITIVDGLVEGISFNEDGSFQVVSGINEGDANIELEIASLTGSQIINVSLENLTHLATNFSATYDQDGYPPGNIVSVGVTSDGIMEGVATNGRRLEIAQLAVATFVNNQGLENIGGNSYVSSSNSGVAQVGPALSGGGGGIRGGQLETSNVDVALEFTQLIVAQRGFSANARSITVASEVLEELNTIIR
ncbi:MAG: flagellar hook protein FlgE [Mariniblastus sp.]|jgi:flagellar hook protein FlgE